MGETVYLDTDGHNCTPKSRQLDLDVMRREADMKAKVGRSNSVDPKDKFFKFAVVVKICTKVKWTRPSHVA